MKLNKLLLFLLTLGFSTTVFAQNSAQVQIIHNSPDDALSQVDIYDADGNSIVSGLSFRDATPFVSINFTGSSYDLQIAPAGSPVSDAVGFTLNGLMDGGQYVVVANGILPGNSGNYDDFEPLNLDVKTMARQSANNANNADVLVHHGSPGAGAVDVAEVEQGLGTFLTNVPYSAFSSYQELPAEDYKLEVRPNGSSTVVGRYQAPLSSQAGDAITVFASGFINPPANNDGPAFGLFAALPNGTVIQLPLVEEAQVQFIHNVADQAASSVDVFVNGNRQFEDFSFQSATGYVTLPANEDIDIGIATPGSPIQDTLVNFTVNLNPYTNYAGVVNGTVNDQNFSNPQPLTLNTYVNARKDPNQAGNIDILVHHGATDAPAVDIVETGVGAGTLVDSITYGDYRGYLEVGPANYEIEVRANSNGMEQATFRAPLSDLGLADTALTIVASGFLNPPANNDGPAFGLFAVLPSGTVQQLPLVQEAQVQFIHNVADPAAETVDVFVNGNRQFEDFAYKSATGYVSLPANEDLNIGLAAPGDALADTLVNFSLNLDSETNYVGVVNGTVMDQNFSNPQPLTLNTYVGGRMEAQQGGNTDLLIHHGSTDAPAVNIVETQVTDSQELVNGIAYSQFDNQYISLNTDDYVLSVQQNGNEVKSFQAPLSSQNLIDSAIVAVATGFLNPANNNDGDPLGILAVTPSGRVIELPEFTGLNDKASQVAFKAYPNPVSDNLRVNFDQNEFDQARIDVVSMDGHIVTTERTAPQGTHTLNMEDLTNGTYIIRVSADGQTIGTRSVVKE